MSQLLEAVQVKVDITELVVGQVELRQVGQRTEHVLSYVPG